MVVIIFKNQLRNLCLIWQRLLLFLLICSSAIAADPSVCFSVIDNGGNCNLSLRGFSIDPFKSCVIKIKYPSDADIDNALISSSVKSLSVGAYIDDVNNILRVNISQSKKISIDNKTLAEVVFPVSGTGIHADLSVQSAEFTDYAGTTFNAVISKDVCIKNSLSAKKVRSDKFSGYYLLNGQNVSGNTIKNMRSDKYCKSVSVRVLTKIDKYK